METPPRGFIAPCVFIFTVIILRNIYIDVIAFQGDLIFGRQSLPTLLGMEKTTYLAILFSLLSSVVYAVLTAESGNYALLLFTVNLLYAGVIYIRVFSRNYYTSLWHEILLDLNLASFIALYLAY
jgi:4-hydroxybenzoate polyprenyltransferase